jgi:hypothetical protein
MYARKRNIDAENEEKRTSGATKNVIRQKKSYAGNMQRKHV